jgi:hypothetical protein
MIKQLTDRQQQKLTAANEVLAIFAAGTVISQGDRGWVVSWTNHKGIKVVRKFSTTSGGISFPVWHKKWGHGGTCCQALTALVRWLQERPVPPLAWWEYRTGEEVKLGGDRRDEIVDILRSANYAEDRVEISQGQ